MKNKKFCSIRKNSEISTIFSKGKIVSNGEFIVKYLFYRNFRLALSVNKKYFKTAILRNKIKRQIREMLYAIDNLPNISALIIIKPSYNIKDFNLMKEKLVNLINKIK